MFYLAQRVWDNLTLDYRKNLTQCKGDIWIIHFRLKCGSLNFNEQVKNGSVQVRQAKLSIDWYTVNAWFFWLRGHETNWVLITEELKFYASETLRTRYRDMPTNFYEGIKALFTVAHSAREIQNGGRPALEGSLMKWCIHFDCLIWDGTNKSPENWSKH